MCVRVKAIGYEQIFLTDFTNIPWLHRVISSAPCTQPKRPVDRRKYRGRPVGPPSSSPRCAMPHHPDHRSSRDWWRWILLDFPFRIRFLGKRKMVVKRRTSGSATRNELYDTLLINGRPTAGWSSQTHLNLVIPCQATGISPSDKICIHGMAVSRPYICCSCGILGPSYSSRPAWRTPTIWRQFYC